MSTGICSVLRLVKLTIWNGRGGGAGGDGGGGAGGSEARGGFANQSCKGGRRRESFNSTSAAIPSADVRTNQQKTKSMKWMKNRPETVGDN